LIHAANTYNPCGLKLVHFDGCTSGVNNPSEIAQYIDFSYLIKHNHDIELMAKHPNSNTTC